MTPYYSDDLVTIYHGDSLEIMPTLERASAEGRNVRADATDDEAADIEAAARFDVIVTDPPYGIGFQSGWTGSAIVGDADTAVRDSVLAWWGDRPALVFGSWKSPVPGSKACLVWHKPGLGMGDLNFPWQPDFELIYVRGSGFASTFRGSSVLTYPVRVYRGDALHPHQKPDHLMTHLIERCPPGTVLDPFMGSGTTLVAAKALGRRAIGIEIDERYCERAATRCSQETLGLSAIA